MRYIVVLGEDIRDLERRVENYLKANWKPQGGVAISKCGRYLQAVVRED